MRVLSLQQAADAGHDAGVAAAAPGLQSVRTELNTQAPGPSNPQRQSESDDDRVLVEQARAGNTAAFRKLVERHQRRALAVAQAIVRDEQDAREVVQEAFLRVHRGLDGFTASSSFFTWLYRIVNNLAIDLRRRPALRREVPYDESREVADQPVPLLARIEGADPSSLVDRRELADRIRQAVNELPPYHRGVIVMRELEGMSYEEMAVAMGVSKGTIMSRLFHARQKLQKQLAGVYEEHVGHAPPASEGGGP